ncbi:MAG: hypothetical protein COA66_10115 [Arcobacter sp.]|nr:MAG: hypothetical protein COA66_10115 [Arcobacter sp.]
MNHLFAEVLRGYFNDYISELEDLSKSQNTIDSYSSTISTFIYFIENEHQKDMSFKNIRRSDFTKFLTYKSNNLNKHEDSKPASKALYITHLSQYFEYISSESIEKLDFTAIFKKLKIPIPKREPKGVNDEDVEKVLDYLKNKVLEANNYDSSKSRAKSKNAKQKKQFLAYRNSLLMKMYLYTGIRASELIGVKIKNFNLIKENLYVFSIIGKGNKEAKAYILASFISEEVNFFKRNDYQLISITVSGNILDRTQTWKVFSTIYKNCNVKASGIHILRHTFAKDFYKKTKDLRSLQAILRHVSINTTMIYAAENDEQTQDNYLLAFENNT